MQTNIAVISERWKLTRAGLTKKISVLMLEFTDQRFREQGWLDASLKPWEQRKNNKDKGRALLIKTGRLRRGNRVIMITETSVTIGNDVPYARAMNDGVHGVITIKAHSRKRIASTVKENLSSITKNGKARKVTVLKFIGDTQVKQFTRNANTPGRKYIGDSIALRGRIKELIIEEVNKCFK